MSDVLISANNKLMLGNLCYEHVVTKAKEIQTADINLIIFDETKTKPTVGLKSKSAVPLDLWKKSPFEEADLRLPYHVWKALRAGRKTFLMLSNDTDIIVSFLFQTNFFYGWIDR